MFHIGITSVRITRPISSRFCDWQILIKNNNNIDKIYFFDLNSDKNLIDITKDE